MNMNDSAKRAAIAIARNELFESEEMAIIHNASFREAVKNWFLKIHGEGSSIDITVGDNSLHIDYFVP